MGLQNTRFHAVPYTADSVDFPKFAASFNYGTVIAPMNFLYEKAATGMENLKMEYLILCRQPTSQYGSAKYPVSCSTV